MGLPSSTGLTADQGANGEWMELANISGAEVSLDGWRILDAAGKIKISFGSGDMLAPDGFYLLSRGGNSVHGISTDKAYAGTLPNTGDELAVLDPSSSIIIAPSGGGAGPSGGVSSGSGAITTSGATGEASISSTDASDDSVSACE